MPLRNIKSKPSSAGRTVLADWSMIAVGGTKQVDGTACISNKKIAYLAWVLEDF